MHEKLLSVQHISYYNVGMKLEKSNQNPCFINQQNASLLTNILILIMSSVRLASG
jgi:hypothetical protein